MASTYSPSLKLELMATGDQSGTWGVTNNTNLGTLLEQAITGVLSVAQGDVANLTLTSLDGASDQARNAVINLTGAMTAGRNVVVPTANKVYLVKNSTTGGFAVTVKTAAGTGVAIAAGTAQWVYCDGTNVVQGLSGTLASQAAASVAITGGTITGLTSLTLASGAATPATNDAAALGTSTLMWSDLFLASGGVINFNNGNYTLTHSAGVLTANGAFSIGTGNALTAGTIELGAATDTTISRGAAGFIAVEGKRVPSPASQASGDILYRGATEWERLAKGTAAQVLTMNAGATAPEWATPTAGGMTLLGTLTTTSGSTQALTGIAATYKYLQLVFNTVSANASFGLTLELSSTNGAAYGAAVALTTAAGTASARSFSGAVNIYAYTVAVTGKVAQCALALDNGTIAGSVSTLAVLTNTSAACNALRVGTDSGSFDLGSVQVYGVS